MLEHFKGFIGYSDAEFKELWEKAIFVIDTNILINFYKYTSKESTRSLLDILKKMKDENRLWIPHQVALEYFFNYESNMFIQKEGYNLLGNELIKLKDDATKTLSTVKSKHPYIMTENFNFFIENIEKLNKSLNEKLNEEMNNLPDPILIQQELFNLLDGITGEPYSQEKINAIEKEGKDRYQHDVPPGFKDKSDNNKQGFRTYGDFRYQRLYGDLIVWYQIIDKANNEDNPTPIILITEDRKEDWWEKEGQHIKRPHPQLIQEFLNKTGQKIYMYRTENFIKNAKKYLEANITEEQLQEVRTEIENIRKVEDMKINIKSHQYVSIHKLNELLTENQKDVFLKLLSQADSNFLNDTEKLNKYDEAIGWAIRVAMPKLETMFKNQIIFLNSLNRNKGRQAQNIYDSLPEDPVDRILTLFSEIETIEKAIDFYRAFPDGEL